MSQDAPGPDEPTPTGIDPYRELFEHSSDPMTIIEGDRFIDCNPAAIKRLRMSSRADVLAMHPSQISPLKQPDGRDSFEKANELIALAFREGGVRFEWDHMTVDGEVFPVEVSLTALQQPGRRVLHAVWRDLAERRALEEQLRHAQKMEAIGKLAGGIAHDFNNLLVAVQGHADLLGMRLTGDPSSMEHLEHIKEAGHRAAALVQQLLAFGRKQEIMLRVLDLNALIVETAGLLKPLLGDEVTLELSPTGSPIHVKADQGQLEQVLMNLAANARDAMPGGGHLRISLATVQLARPRIGTTKTLEPGPYGVITVTDTGTGMSEETRKRAFDPFFTTKGVGKGTGLGLATSYGIVTQCGGELTLDSKPGHGTTVEVYLPVTSEAPAPAAEAPHVRRDGGGSETILVVEDEPVVSELIVEALKGQGYSVLLACDGMEAVERFHEHADDIALILTDVMMPRKSGMDLVKELSAEGYNPPVLFMSGYTNNALPQLAALEGRIDLIKKPFKLTELAQRIRDALERTD